MVPDETTPDETTPDETTKSEVLETGDPTDTSATTTSDVPLDPLCVEYGETQADCTGGDPEGPANYCQTQLDEAADNEECRDATYEQFTCLANASCDDWSSGDICAEALNEVGLACDDYNYSFPTFEIPEVCENVSELISSCLSLGDDPDYPIEEIVYSCSFDFYFAGEEGPSQNDLADLLERHTALAGGADEEPPPVEDPVPNSEEYSDYFEYQFCPGGPQLYECLSTLDCQALEDREGCETQIDNILGDCTDKLGETPQACKDMMHNLSYCGFYPTELMKECVIERAELVAEDLGELCLDAFDAYANCRATVTCEQFFEGGSCEKENEAIDEHCYPEDPPS